MYLVRTSTSPKPLSSSYTGEALYIKHSKRGIHEVKGKFHIWIMDASEFIPSVERLGLNTGEE
jgi:hypothetical protein